MTTRMDVPPKFFLGQNAHAGYERLLNEDEHGWFSTPAGELLIVAGGGGSGGATAAAGGGVASRLAVAAAYGYMKSHGGAPEALLREAILAADEAVMETEAKYTELQGVGSTLAILLWRNGEIWFGQLGPEGLLYVLDGGVLKPLGGIPVSGEALSLALALGGGLEASSLEIGHRVCGVDDVYLLATQTLSSLVSRDKIETILQSPVAVEEKARLLVATAVEGGGQENVTVQVLAFNSELEKPVQNPTWVAKYFWPGFLSGMLIGLIGLIIWQFFGLI